MAAYARKCQKERDFEGTVTFNSDPNTWETDWSAYFDIVNVFSVDGFPDFEETSEDYSEFSGSGTWSINSDGQLVGVEMELDEDLSQYEGQIDQVYDIEVVNNDRIILTMDYDFTTQDPNSGLSIAVTGTAQTVIERK